MKGFPTLLSFFLLTIALVKASPAALEELELPAAEAVVDTSGEKLRAGGSYFILPFVRGQGGGLTLRNFGNDPTTCPRVVVQEPFETLNGLPVKFLPSNPKHHVVYTQRNLNIQFANSPVSTCVESNVWKLTKFISEGLNVGTNGEVGNQDFSAIYNWFTIEKASEYNTEGVYHLKFCPKPGVVTCDNLGIFNYGGHNKKYLGLTNPASFKPFPVVFAKAYAPLLTILDA